MLTRSREFALKELKSLAPLGPDYQDRIAIYTRLGAIAACQLKLDESHKQLDEALRIKRATGSTSSLSGDIYMWLSQLARLEGHRQSAKDFDKSGLEAYKNCFSSLEAGRYIFRRAEEILNLSESVSREHRYTFMAGAEHWLLTAEQLMESSVDGSFRDLSDLYGVLANLYRKQGRFGKASQLYQKYMTTEHQTSEATPQKTVLHLINLGDLLRLAKRPDEAGSCLDRARSIALRLAKTEPGYLELVDRNKAKLDSTSNRFTKRL